MAVAQLQGEAGGGRGGWSQEEQLQGALSAYFRILDSQKVAEAEGLWQLTGPIVGRVCNLRAQQFPLETDQIHPLSPGSKGRRAGLEPNPM